MLTKDQAKKIMDGVKGYTMADIWCQKLKQCLDEVTEPDPQSEPKFKVGDTVIVGDSGLGTIEEVRLDHLFSYKIKWYNKTQRDYYKKEGITKVIHFQPSGKKFEDLVAGDTVIWEKKDVVFLQHIYPKRSTFELDECEICILKGGMGDKSRWVKKSDITIP